MEALHLLNRSEIEPTINEFKEADSRFTIYEDMVESYLYLNKGHFSVNLVNSDSPQEGFEVRTEDTTEIFETPQATNWVSLLN